MMGGSMDFNNTEDVCSFHFSSLHLTLYLVVTLPLWFMNVVGNSFILLCVYQEKQLRRPSYFLIAALSVADITVPFFGYITTTIQEFVKNPWVCDPFVQSFLSTPSTFAGFTSFLTLVALTSERYMSIAFPVLHRKTVTTRRVLAVVTFNWILSACACVAGYPFRPSTLQRLYCAPFQLGILAIAVPFGFVGLILLSSLNAHLLILIKRRLRRDAERHTASQSSEAEIRRGNMNCKASKAVSTVVIFFVISWLPITLFLLSETLNHTIDVNCTFLEVGRKLLSVSFIVNGAINPIVYARQNPQFRSVFKKRFGRPSTQVSDSPEV